MGKLSLTISGHRTSISLEEPFLEALRETAVHEGLAVAELVRRIDHERENMGLSSAVRIYLLEHYRKRAAPE